MNTVYSGISDGMIEGGRGVVWSDTELARQRCQLPEHYLVIQADEDGFHSLDFSRTGPDCEHPVVYHMPFRKTPFAESAPSYAAWLLDDLRAMVEAWSEDD